MPDTTFDPARSNKAAEDTVKRMRQARGATKEEPNTPEENQAASKAIEDDRKAQEEEQRQKSIGMSGYFGHGF